MNVVAVIVFMVVSLIVVLPGFYGIYDCLCKCLYAKHKYVLDFLRRDQNIYSGPRFCEKI